MAWFLRSSKCEYPSFAYGPLWSVTFERRGWRSLSWYPSDQLVEGRPTTGQAKARRIFSPSVTSLATVISCWSRADTQSGAKEEAIDGIRFPGRSSRSSSSCPHASLWLVRFPMDAIASVRDVRARRAKKSRKAHNGVRVCSACWAWGRSLTRFLTNASNRPLSNSSHRRLTELFPIPPLNAYGLRKWRCEIRTRRAAERRPTLPVSIFGCPAAVETVSFSTETGSYN